MWNNISTYNQIWFFFINLINFLLYFKLKKSVCVLIPFKLAILAIFLQDLFLLLDCLFNFSRKKPSLLAISQIKLFFKLLYFFNFLKKNSL